MTNNDRPKTIACALRFRIREGWNLQDRKTKLKLRNGKLATLVGHKATFPQREAKCKNHRNNCFVHSYPEDFALIQLIKSGRF